MSDATQAGAFDDDILSRIGSTISDEPDTEDNESEVNEDNEARFTESDVDDHESTDDDQQDRIELEADDLASIFGLRPEDFTIDEDGRPKIKVRIDDDERLITLEDLRRGYQLDSAGQQRLRMAHEAMQQFEAEKQQAAMMVATQLQQTGAMLQSAEQMLLAEYQGINWQELRQKDPAEYSARQADFNNRAGQIQMMKQNAAQQAAAVAQAQQADFANHMRAVLEQERRSLSDAIPQWRDASTAAKERKQLREHLMKDGYSQSEVDSIINHRHVVTARKAMLYDQLMANKGAVKDKLEGAPKTTLKPGKAMGKRGKQARSLDDKRRQLKRSGSVRDAASLIESKLF